MDSNKDQSYFLWQVRKEQLPHILFPVGGMQKTEVRRLAKKFGLTTADKKDSQGLCFVGKVDMKEFLSHYIKPRRGNVLDARGRIIGVHNGVFFYTIGERLGLPTRSDLVSGKRPDLVVAGPCYVIDKDTRKNTLTVSHKGPSGTLPVAQKEILIEDCNWLVPPVSGSEYQARVRYRQPPQNAKIKNQKAKWVVCFERPQTIASGQSLVLYDGNVVVGGGIIC